MQEYCINIYYFSTNYPLLGPGIGGGILAATIGIVDNMCR